MSASQAVALTGERPFARTYVHQAMVGLDGEKMSKSKGNLVLVSKLRADGVDPMAIRLALLGQHYRTDWDWTDQHLERAQERLETGAPPCRSTLARARRRRCSGSASCWRTTSTPLARSRRWTAGPRTASREEARTSPRPGSWRARSTPCSASGSDGRPPQGGTPGHRQTGESSGRRGPRRRGVSGRARAVLSAPAQVALELARDRVSAGLGELRGVLGLLEGLDVLRDLLVGLRELVDAALPRTRGLGQVAVRDGESSSSSSLEIRPSVAFGDGECPA